MGVVGWCDIKSPCIISIDMVGAVKALSFIDFAGDNPGIYILIRRRVMT